MRTTVERYRSIPEVPPGTSIPEFENDFTRREFLIGAGLLVLAAGCDGGGGAATGGEEGPNGTRTIEHKYGSTEISGRPERVVTVGLTEQDYVLALGVAPVGVREWYGGHPGALWPWAREELGDRPLPEVLPVEELNIEQNAALETDLILGVNSGLTQEEYDTLSEIAPTVAQPEGYADFGAPWQEITRVVGRALGRSDQAEGLIPPVEARFERARAEHPEFEDSTGLLAATVNDGSFYVYAEGPAPRFLTSLGLKMPRAAAALFSVDDRGPCRSAWRGLRCWRRTRLSLACTAPIRRAWRTSPSTRRWMSLERAATS